MAKLPIITLRSEVDIKQFGNQNIFDLYQTISNQFKATLNYSHLLDFFATPSITGRGEIHWHTNLNDKPIPFSEVTHDEKISAVSYVNLKSEAVVELANKIDSGETGSNHIARAMRQMMITPNLEQSLFKLGDKWVLSQWGCYDYGANSNDFTIEQHFKKILTVEQPIAPTYESIPVAEEKVIAPHPEPEPEIKWENEKTLPFKKVEPETKTNKTTTQDTLIVKPRSKLWRWIVLLSLLLLLLLGLMIRGCQEINNGSSNNEIIIRQQINELWSKVKEKSLTCFPESTNSNVELKSSTPTHEENEDVDKRLAENSISRGNNLNVALTWKGKADLDLIAQEPSGNNICIYNFCDLQSPISGASLDIDANQCILASGCQNVTKNPIENISWNSKPPAGIYSIYVVLYTANENTNSLSEIPFSIEVTNGVSKKNYKGSFKVSEMKCKLRCSAEKLITKINID